MGEHCAFAEQSSNPLVGTADFVHFSSDSRTPRLNVPRVLSLLTENRKCVRRIGRLFGHMPTRDSRHRSSCRVTSDSVLARFYILGVVAGGRQFADREFPPRHSFARIVTYALQYIPMPY